MAASLIEVLARRLDLSEQQAQEHLRAFVSELKAQAERDGRATVPDLGAFFALSDGGLDFEPSEPLAQAANRSFAALEPLDLAPTSAQESVPADAPEPTPPSADQDEFSRAETTQGDDLESNEPDLESEWLPTFAQHPEEEHPEEERSEEEHPEEEHPEEEHPEEERSVEEEPAPAEQKSEEQTLSSIFAPSETSSQEGAEEVPAQDSPFKKSPSTESEAPLATGEASAGEAEQEPGPFEESDSSRDRSLPSWSYGALPAGYLVRPRASLAPSALRGAALHAPGAPAPHPGGMSAPAERARRQERTRQERTRQERTRQERTPEKHMPRTPPSKEPASATDESGGSALRWVVAGLLLVALGLGIWYVLGQQSDVSGPVAASEQSAAAADTSQTSPAGAAGSGSDTTTAADASQSGNAASGGASAEKRKSAWAQADRIDREAGGWTIIVASETSRARADTTARAFAERFSDTSYPIDILEGSTDGITRHRVAIGQFASNAEARRALESATPQLPDGAWTLQIQPGG